MDHQLARIADVREVAPEPTHVQAARTLVLGRTRLSDTAGETFGWTRGEAIGAILGDLIIPPQLREAHNKGLKRFLETGVGPVAKRRNPSA